MGDVVGHLHRLRDGFDRLGVDHLLRCVEMAHQQSEEPEEHEEHGQTEEHDAHGEQGDAEAMWILTLQFGVFGLVGLDEVLDTRCHVLCRLHRPLVAMSCIALVSSQCRNSDRVYQFDSITIIEADPYGFRHRDSQ